MEGTFREPSIHTNPCLEIVRYTGARFLMDVLLFLARRMGFKREGTVLLAALLVLVSRTKPARTHRTQKLMGITTTEHGNESTPAPDWILNYLPPLLLSHRGTLGLHGSNCVTTRIESARPQPAGSHRSGSSLDRWRIQPYQRQGSSALSEYRPAHFRPSHLIHLSHFSSTVSGLTSQRQ
jgi:hypothetical protein